MSPKQIATLIDAHLPALLLYARQFGAAAEDVVQEAFLRLLRQRTWPNDVVPWLYQVVRNVALDAVKTQQRRQKREQVVAQIAQSVRWFIEPEIDGLDAETAVNALRDLPIELREVIVAHLWGGLTFEQIGNISSTAASTACRRYQAGLVLLREKLGTPCPSNH